MGAAPLACVPGAIPAAERAAHFALLRWLFGEELRELAEVENGFRFRFDADSFEEVARFVANERNCCPFLVVRLEVEAAGGPVWLEMSGPRVREGFSTRS